MRTYFILGGAGNEFVSGADQLGIGKLIAALRVNVLNETTLASPRLTVIAILVVNLSETTQTVCRSIHLLQCGFCLTEQSVHLVCNSYWNYLITVVLPMFGD